MTEVSQKNNLFCLCDTVPFLLRKAFSLHRSRVSRSHVVLEDITHPSMRIHNRSDWPGAGVKRSFLHVCCVYRSGKSSDEMGGIPPYCTRAGASPPAVLQWLTGLNLVHSLGPMPLAVVLFGCNLQTSHWNTEKAL